MKKIIARLALLSLLVCSIEVGSPGGLYLPYIHMESAAAPEKPVISSEAGIVLRADKGEVLFGKNENKRYYPASITKILTALLVLEKADMEGSFTFSQSAVSNLDTGAVTIGAAAGDKMSVRAALYALMLKSANEVANGLAEYTAGSEAEFARQMTAKAKALGAKDSNFVNAHGLSNAAHYTTAYDMALITKAAFEHEDFLEIAGTTNYTLPALGTKPAAVISMGHKMMHKADSRYYAGILGGKTGYTKSSGNTLVTVVEREGVRLIVVVLKSTGTHYADTKALLDYGFAAAGISAKSSLSSQTSSQSETAVQTAAPVSEAGPGAQALKTTAPSQSAVSTDAPGSQGAADSLSMAGPGMALSSGSLQSGWVEDAKGWRYVKENKSFAVNERLDINGYTYWFDADTYMASSWRKDARGLWYCMRDSGEMRKSQWILYKDLWYYVGTDGAMLQSTTTPDGYKVNSDGVWIQE